jgi:glycopeptide antibiotics resistance protein
MNDFVNLILAKLREGLIFAVLAVIVAAAAIAAAYIIAKKRGRRTTFPIARTVSAVLLVAVAAVIVYATLIRTSAYSAVNLHLFRAFREAWNNYSLQNWLNLLLNVAMFVPVGLLLPIIFKAFECWYVTVGTGIAASAAIELIQLCSGRGLCDVDDVAANVIGTAIGYCLVMIFIRARGGKKSWMVYAAIPAAAALFLGGVFAFYQLKPYGNLDIAPDYTVSTKGVHWQFDFTPSDSAASAAVYKSEKYDRESCRAFAEQFFQAVGGTFDDVAYYDDETWFMSHSSGRLLTVNHSGKGHTS